MFFQESAKKILLIDNGLYNNITKIIEDFSNFIELEYEILKAGIDYFKIKILNIYYKWKFNTDNVQLMDKEKIIADYSLFNELIPLITKLDNHISLIYNMFDIMVMLTAAKKLACIISVEQYKNQITYYRDKCYNTQLRSINDSDFQKCVIPTKSNSGFIARLSLDNILYGYLEVEDIMFPQYINKYMKLSESLSKVLALAISNSFNFELLELEKIDAQSANKIKSQFLANMSHEIRTPINGVLGFLQLLNYTNLNDEQKMLIKNIQISAESLLCIINDILDLSKIEAGKIVIENITFDFKYAIESTLILFTPKLIEKNLETIINISPDISNYVIGDPTRLKQILTNLISNAIKFTDKGSLK